MSTFYFNRFSGESANSQWMRYLQNRSYISDIGEIVSQNRKDLQSTLNTASAEQKQAFQQVCGTLDDGFREISQHLQSINCNISELRGEICSMAAMLNWKLSLLIEEQRLTNQLLGHIAQLLRIPDSQKQRVYHIEQGLKYLKNAILEGIDSTFYADALEGFREAERIERKDYITLNRIGQIYLYSQKHMNIPLAEEYFLKSAREAFAEANAGGTPTASHFIPQGHQSTDDPFLKAKQLMVAGNKIGAIKAAREASPGLGLAEAKERVESWSKAPPTCPMNPFIAATAEAYLYASRACYLQNKLAEAAKHAGRAYTLIPGFVEAGFEQAKYLAANDQDDEAVAVLQAVITQDRFFAVKTWDDADLRTKKAVLNLLADFQAKANSQAKQELTRCQSIIRRGSEARSLVEEAERHVAKNSFIAGMKALDVLTAQHQLPYKEYRKGSGRYDESSESIYRRTLTPSLTLVEFINAENQCPKQLETLKAQVKKEIITSRAWMFGLGGAAIGFAVGFCRGCTAVTSPGGPKEDMGTWFGTFVFCAVVGAVIGGVIGSATEPSVRD